MTSPSSSGALEAVERILNRGGEPEDVLGAVIETLRQRTNVNVGVTRETPPQGAQAHDIVWQGARVATLWADTETDAALFARVAVIVAPYFRK
jgi:hypothetical protein